MKKFLLLLTISTLIMTIFASINVFAAPASGIPYINLEYEEILDNGKTYVVATASVKSNGSTKYLASATAAFQYDAAALKLVNPTTKVAITSNSNQVATASAAIVDLTQDSSHANYSLIKNYSMAPGRVSPAAGTQYSNQYTVQFGFSAVGTTNDPRILLAADTTVPLYKVYFEKIGTVTPASFSAAARPNSPNQANCAITLSDITNATSIITYLTSNNSLPSDNINTAMFVAVAKEVPPSEIVDWTDGIPAAATIDEGDVTTAVTFSGTAPDVGGDEIIDCGVVFGGKKLYAQIDDGNGNSAGRLKNGKFIIRAIGIGALREGTYDIFTFYTTASEYKESTAAVTTVTVE